MVYIVTEAKLKNFADDMTCFLKDKNFYPHLFTPLKVLKYFPITLVFE